MTYYSISLRFTSPVHFGQGLSACDLSSSDMNFKADTFFSALASAALKCEGTEGINCLYEKCREGKILFSDSMPSSDETVWLPRPFVLPEKRQMDEKNADQRKAIKKMKFIPAEEYEDFISSFSGKGLFNPKNLSQCFGSFRMEQKVMVRDEGDSEPYSVGVFSFAEGFGLTIITACENESDFDYILKLVKLLSYEGIGGKISSGCGKFKIHDCGKLEKSKTAGAKALMKMLLNEKAERFVSLTTSLPKPEELEEVLNNACFKTSRRSGFTTSETYSKSPVKKKTQYFLTAGSVFDKKYYGDIYDVSEHDGSHPVWRYSKPIFLGVGSK